MFGLLFKKKTQHRAERHPTAVKFTAVNLIKSLKMPTELR
jgi:hypothetical protein